MSVFGECEEIINDSKIVRTDPGSKNKKSKFCLVNSKKTKVRVIRVDGCAIKEGIRCDYLIILSNEQELYVELKGSDVKHAVEQIEATIQKLTTNISTSKLCFISSSRCPITSTEIQNLKRKFKKNYQAKLIIKNGEITHKI